MIIAGIIAKFTNRLKALHQEENASVFIIVAASILMMIAAVGAAVDTSRYIIAKNNAITALDAATLAAATVAESAPDLNAVGQNFFDANFEPGRINTNLGAVTINYDTSTGIISGTINGTIKNNFMGMFGLTTLNINAYTEIAWQDLADMEVVLAMDSSGSMCPDSVKVPMNSWSHSATAPCVKLQALKDASISFVNVLFGGGTVTANVGLVPFSHWVNGGGRTRPSSMVTSPYNTWNAAILPPVTGLTDVKADLISQLNNLRTGNTQNTRVNVGLNVAWLMLRPDSVASFNHKDAATHPASFSTAGINKIAVLMTDGLNATYGYGSPSVSVYGNTYSFLPGSGAPTAADYDSPSTSSRRQYNDYVDLLNRCEKMKADNIIIYTVIFDLINPTLENIFKRCASLPTSPYFNSVDCTSGYAACGADLVTTYENIAYSLRKLRINK